MSKRGIPLVHQKLKRSTLATLTALLAGGLALSAAGCAADDPEPAPTVTEPPTATATPEPEPEPPAFDTSAHSIDDPESIWVVVNKLRPLNPVEYVPDDLVYPQVDNTNGQPLREIASQATEQMVAAASADGVYLRIISAYRSYETQVSVYGGFVANQGQAYADTTSARPGHSEHQTGLTADFDADDGCTLDECFANTPSGLWLHEHAPEYGFIERYPAGKEPVTGYMPEPWHYRYVGTELALEMRDQGVTTLEEFFDLPAAPDYGG